MTLADHLPPVGWAGVATKADLHVLGTRFDSRISQAETRFERRTADLQRTLSFAILGAFTANTGIVVAVLHASGIG